MNGIRLAIHTVLFCLIFFALGCQKFEGYDFTSPEIVTEFGSVRAKMYGKKKDWFFFSKQAEPYDLILKFDFKDRLPDKIEILNIRVVSDSGNNLVYEKLNHWVEIDKDTDKKYVYYELASILGEYIETNVDITFDVWQEGTVLNYSIRIPFSKDYKELWQSLLSV